MACGQCTRECDMGIPVQHLVETKGEVNVPDCVGCGRCITNCPKEVLRFSDVRNLFKRTSAVESDLPADVEHSDGKSNIISLPTLRRKNHEPSILEIPKDVKSNGSSGEFLKTSIILDADIDEDFHIKRKSKGRVI